MTDGSFFEDRLNPWLAEGAASSAPPRPEAISQQVGIPLEELVRLSANESPLGTSPRVREALHGASESAELHRYPARNYVELTTELAGFVGVEESQILPTAGASEVLPLVFRAFCPPGSRVAYVHPGIPRVGVEAQQYGLAPHRIQFSEPYRVEAEFVVSKVPVDTRLLFITSPNNTTSRLVARETLAEICEGLPDTIVFVDEHYVEAADDFRESSAVRLLGSFENVIVARTFSKVHGMAGIRAGYAVAHPEAIATLRRIRSRWPLGVPAEAAALAALRDIEHLEATRSVIRQGRAFLEEALSQISSLDVVPEPQGNFLLVRTQHAPREIMEGLWRHGVLINGFLHPDHIRITVGTEVMNQKLVTALEAVVSDLETGTASTTGAGT